MEDAPAAKPTELREYLQIIRRRGLIIVITMLITVGLAVGYSELAAPSYTATSTVLVPQQQANAALNIQDSQLPAAASLQRSLADEQQFAKGDAVKQAAAKLLGFRASVSIGGSTTDDVLSFTATNGSKRQAAAIANAYANAYISARRTNEVDQYTQQVTALEQSITSLQSKAASLPPGDVQIPALQQSIAALTQSVEQAQAASQVADQIGPSILKAATLPSSPSSPKPVRNGILALLIGVIVGAALALLVERLDDGITSREAAERAAGGLPVISLIPAVPSWRGKGQHHLALVDDPSSAPSEAYRTLRTAVQFLGIDEPKRVIGLTSSVPGEGKTTTVANLAVSFARAGLRVIAVSCDLRRPRLHEFFETDNARGLTSVILGHATLEEALTEFPGEPGLKVLPSGPIPPNPAEILALDKVREVIDYMATQADVVLLDCPPILPVTDALLISRLVDGMLTVAAIDSTSIPNLRRATELLNQVGAPLLGTVLNRVPSDGPSSYAYYGYGYGYAEYSSAEYSSEVPSQLAGSPLNHRKVPDGDTDVPSRNESDTSPNGRSADSFVDRGDVPSQVASAPGPYGPTVMAPRLPGDSLPLVDHGATGNGSISAVPANEPHPAPLRQTLGHDQPGGATESRSDSCNPD